MSLLRGGKLSVDAVACETCEEDEENRVRGNINNIADLWFMMYDL